MDVPMKYQMNREFIEGQARRGVITEREYRNYKWKLRRQREVRKHIVLFLFTICLIIGMVISYHSIVSHAESRTEAENISFKYYTEIEVDYGDSLWSIANVYADNHFCSTRTYIQEVKNINHLKGDVIKEGQKLIIPYYSNEFK